jgi:MFS transporter, DHA1 family, multidrug resistance protein
MRDAALGQIIRWATKGRLLKYPEEEPNFQLPLGYIYVDKSPACNVPSTTAGTNRSNSPAQESAVEDGQPDLEYDNDLRTVETAKDQEAERHLSKITSSAQISRIPTRVDLERAYSNATLQESVKQQASRPITPTHANDGTILVDWYSTTDEANPQNWSHTKKTIVVFQIYFYTLAVYLGSAIITPAQPYYEQKFGITPEVASLGLSMYVLGYGTGPMLFSPLSEIPVVGRNPPYIITFSIFVAISIGVSFVNNFPALVVLRFLQGFFGSPCLATGGASIGDIYSLLRLPYYLTGWAAFATAGPALSPLISGFSVPAIDWHFSLWLIAIFTVPVYLVLFSFLPETSSANILLCRAQRLRKLTGNPKLRSESEISQSKLTASKIVVNNLWRPIQINALDPSVLFTSVYTALMYAIFYSFFEVFPFVYATGLSRPNSFTKGYGMNYGEIGLIFQAITIGICLAIPTYFYYLHKIFGPRIKAQGLGEPEWVLVPGLYTCIFVPVGLLLFGWTSFNSPKIHWIIPTIGIVFFAFGIFILFQVIFIYIPLGYPQYAASLFAGNDLARASIAVGAIHFSRPMFLNLGVGPGVSLLAGLTFGGCAGIWALWYFGAALRARSKFAAQ